jgi:microsomal dipeptidase-like Zn-dependent dipeptidase
MWTQPKMPLEMPPRMPPKKPKKPVRPTVPGPVPVTTLTPTPIVATTVIVTPPLALAGLRGWVDMHTHPMVHLGFGGKLVHGAPDVGSLIPTDASCNNKVRATSMEHALGDDKSTSGGWDAFNNSCGDNIRAAVIEAFQTQNDAAVTPGHAGGANTNFAEWPKWDDITHQKMYADWIRRAYDGGLRVMVALATHNQTLAAAVMGPGDGPGDDKASGDLQIDEMKTFFGRHNDFMEIALTAADVRRIVTANKLAIVLGVELDTIGNFNKLPLGALTQPIIAAEIGRLFAKGVRYIFPVHLIDNSFGGTAIYLDIFNQSNYREFGSYWNIGCAAPGDNINHKFEPAGFDLAIAAVKVTKLGIDPFRNPPTPPDCTGHVNLRGLTPEGTIAIKEMMKLGMLIDIDHMSQLTANQALALAESIPGGGYPVASGHNGRRGAGGSENSRTDEQLNRIAKLKGMVGVGCDKADAHVFLQNYKDIASRTEGRAGIGTDQNGLVKGPPPRPGSAVAYDASFPKSMTGGKQWDYNTEGVAHYGLLADFVRDMRTGPGGNTVVDDHFYNAAEIFADMWGHAEAQKTAVH